jgi:NAD+ kinase
VLERVTILFHPRRRQAIQESEWLAAELKRRGASVAVGNGWDEQQVVDLGRGADLVVALGGDGTIIHVASLVAQYEVPVLGVNLGRVGFLAEMTPATMHQEIDTLAAGAYWVEQRAMLDVVWQGEERNESFLSLNEVSVGRGVSPQAVHITALLDGHEFLTYTADAVLVVTATGSTAYSLAAGGPIMYPEDRDFMLTPVAPHLHIGRSIIVPGTSTVRLTLSSDRPAFMSVDGWTERDLKPSHTVVVCRSKMTARFARFGECSYFYTAIAERLK